MATRRRICASEGTNTARSPDVRAACGWLDLPLLRYSGMINGTSWLVVTKLDVLDELAEIPVCVGLQIDGKQTDEMPAQASGYEKIECVYEKLPGLEDVNRRASLEYDKLPKAAREYLAFIDKETGAKIGMISTGPDREHTILMPMSLLPS